MPSPRKLLTALLGITLALSLAACGGRAGENGRIGVIYLNAEGFYAGVKQGVQSTLEADGAAPQLLQTNIQSDASRESTFIDTISSVHADALIVSPASATASIPALELAHESDVPVICYNTCVEEQAARRYVSAYVLGDPTEFGAASGRQMGDYFKDQGIANPKVGVVNCEQFEVCIDRRKGFEAALLKKVPGAKVVANQEGLTLDEALERAEQMLTSDPDIDAFYGEAGSQTIGAVRAVRARGLEGKVVVFGGDMSTQAAEQLEDNSILKGVTDISGIKVGELAAGAAQRVLDGEDPDEFIIPAPIDEYVGKKAATDWIETHPDGIP